jgi:hypothetical protein
LAEQRVFVLHGTQEPVQRVGVHLLRGAGVEVKHVGKSELGDFDDADPYELLRRVDDWAEKKGEGGRAYPTFQSTGESYSPQHEVVYLDARVVQRFDTPIKNLWPEPFEPTQVGHLFRVVHDHCSRNGFVTGFPNGHWSGEGVSASMVGPRRGVPEEQ